MFPAMVVLETPVGEPVPVRVDVTPTTFSTMALDVERVLAPLLLVTTGWAITNGVELDTPTDVELLVSVAAFVSGLNSLSIDGSSLVGCKSKVGLKAFPLSSERRSLSDARCANRSDRLLRG